jgi:hypothetical protein
VKRPLLMLACTLIASASTAAPPRTTFRYTPPPDEERPVVVEALVAPQGSDFAMRLRFDKAPWGEQCKNRCANTTLLLDTDANTTTGLQLDKKLPETGADMAVIIQGTREYKDVSSTGQMRIKVRQLTGESKGVDDGEALADLDNHQDSERVQLDENTLYLLIDATGPTLPSGRKVRVIYRPPAAKPLQATIAGMLSGGSGNAVRIFRGSGSNKGWGKAKEAGTRFNSSPSTGSSTGRGDDSMPRNSGNPLSRSNDNG